MSCLEEEKLIITEEFSVQKALSTFLLRKIFALSPVLRIYCKILNDLLLLLLLEIHASTFHVLIMHRIRSVALSSLVSEKMRSN